MSDTMSEAEVLVEATGVGVERQGRWIIRDIDLTVRRGEIVTLIGPNGGGKTTTARAVLGLTKVDAGHIRRARRLRVGYVPQRLSIDQTLPLTVERLMRLTADVRQEALEDALRQVGIPQLGDAPIQQLSGGEFQRALLARALLRRPDLMVLDEPVQGVDLSGEIALYELIGAIRERLGCGILLISHDLHIVMADTDHVVCLNGHVCCAGPPSSVAADSEYRRLFGARGAGSLAVYRHHHDHAHAPDGRVVPYDGEADSGTQTEGAHGGCGGRHQS